MIRCFNASGTKCRQERQAAVAVWILQLGQPEPDQVHQVQQHGPLVINQQRPAVVRQLAVEEPGQIELEGARGSLLPPHGLAAELRHLLQVSRSLLHLGRWTARLAEEALCHLHKVHVGQRGAAQGFGQRQQQVRGIQLHRSNSGAALAFLGDVEGGICGVAQPLSQLGEARVGIILLTGAAPRAGVLEGIGRRRGGGRAGPCGQRAVEGGEAQPHRVEEGAGAQRLKALAQPRQLVHRQGPADISRAGRGAARHQGSGEAGLGRGWGGGGGKPAQRGVRGGQRIPRLGTNSNDLAGGAHWRLRSRNRPEKV